MHFHVVLLYYYNIIAGKVVEICSHFNFQTVQYLCHIVLNEY